VQASPTERDWGKDSTETCSSVLPRDTAARPSILLGGGNQDVNKTSRVGHADELFCGERAGVAELADAPDLGAKISCWGGLVLIGAK
jgi:hypothetical protein